MPDPVTNPAAERDALLWRLAVGLHDMGTQLPEGKPPEVWLELLKVLAKEEEADPCPT